MICLGIRAEPKQTTFVIYDSNSSTIKNIEQIIVPTILNLPEQLKYMRATMLDILREYNVEAAGIRIAETTSQNQSNERLYIEAVMMEAFASSLVKKIYSGRKNGICARLKITPKEYDNIVKGRDPFGDVTGWPTTKSVNTREAILVAMAAPQ